MTVTEDRSSGHPLGADQAAARPSSAREAVNDMLEAGLLDELMNRVDDGGLALTGEGGFLPEMIKAVLGRGLAAELTSHLGYEKGDPAGRGSPNSRNGTTPKTLASEVGDIPLDVPRDRAGSFEPRLVPKGSRRAGGLDEIIISLYAGGMTVRDIQHHLQRTYGTELSHETISKITDAVLDEVKAWQARPLEEIYPIIYLDALVVKFKDGHQVRNRAAHIAVGVDLDGVKHVLGIWVQASEGAKFWAGVCAELRPIYTAPTVEAAESELLAFAESDLGRRYPAAVATWENAWERFIPFLAFPPEVRKIIYTTNSIESLNYQLRKIIKNRGHFPTDDVVIKLLWLAIRDIEDKRARERAKERGVPANKRKAKPKLVEGAVVNGWKAAFGALAVAYPERLEKYLK